MSGGMSFMKPDAAPWREWVLRQMLSAVDGAPGGATSMFLAEDGSSEGLAVMAWGADDEPDQDAVNAFLIDRGVRAIGMASKVHWSPSDHEPTRDAWMLVAVAGSTGPADFSVRRTVEDDLWRRVEPDYAPFFALSTASALRAVLQRGEPLVFKQTAPGERSDLFNTVHDENWPQEQADGRL